MSAGSVTDRVYDGLKREVLSGRILPGSRLEPSRLAEALASSVTPVRDALSHLSGERLVESRTNEGFFLPHLHEPALRDRYRWNMAVIRAAVSDWSPEDQGSSVIRAGSEYEEEMRGLSELIAARARNPEFATHLRASSDRLAAVRRAEARALPGHEVEVAAMAEAIKSGDRPGLVQLLAKCHRRRERAAPAIISKLYSL